VPSLGNYYRGSLRLVTAPGTRFAYSDHNFATAGQLVEDVAGTPLDVYFRERIFDPLGMTSAALQRPADNGRLAVGYRLDRFGTARPITDRQWVTAAAASVYSTPQDMARYLAALLQGGANEHGRVLLPDSVATMFAPQHQPDPLIPGLGLAFFRIRLGSHALVEHSGVLPGFNSEILLAPDDGLAVMAFTNGARDAMMWLPPECARLLGRILRVPPSQIRTDLPAHREHWASLCGWYPFAGRLTDFRARSIVGAGVRVFVRRGRLMIGALSPVPALLGGLVLHPDDAEDPDVFRLDLTQFGMDTARVVFRRGPGGAVTVHFDLYPLALHKGRWH
jgi:CubicO group peptidase (beta-lactamase class C family)